MYLKRGLQVRSEDDAFVLHEFLAIASLNGSATFVYLVGLVFGLYALVRYADWWRVPLFIVMVLFFFLLDYLEHRRYRDMPPASTAALLLCLRFICITVAALLPPGHMAVFYLSLPYRSTLYFGPKAGYGIAALIIFIYVAFLLSNLHASQQVINNGDIYFWGLCIWAVLKAQSFRREREAQQREYQSRIRAEELLEEVRRSHHQLSIYTEQVATLATMEERNRVAREIHDSLGHSLTAIHLQLKKAITYYSDHPLVALQSVHDAHDVAWEALQDVRRSVRALRTEEQPFSCMHEIARLGAQLRRNGLAVDLVVTGKENAFSTRVLTTLFRIAQEACTNIQRHAQASNVQITLDFGTQSACLQISDDGIGFDTTLPEQGGENKQSYGILGMQERLRLANGVLCIESVPGQGTSLTATISKQGKGEPEVKRSFITGREEDGTDETG